MTQGWLTWWPGAINYSGGEGQKKVGEVQADWFWPALGIRGALAVGIT